MKNFDTKCADISIEGVTCIQKIFLCLNQRREINEYILFKKIKLSGCYKMVGHFI